ncbi:autotransporter domain-containing protein [Thiocapsa sp.]|uniref:autotransporter outer membrane beta-barrel domain-containing protein n=1 Tax=Thiocapsa sp. TaxID=2024551 RepID=UPI003593AFD3
MTASLGYESSTLEADNGLSSADGSVWMAGMGLKYQSGPLLPLAMVDVGSGNFDSTRRIIVGDDVFAATGSPDVSNVGLHGRISYQLPYRSFYLRPSIDLDASYVELDGYTETGAGEFNLAVGGTDGWVTAATPMVEIGTRIDAGNGTVLRPYLGLGLALTSGDDWVIESRFDGAAASAGSFASTIDNPDTLGIIRAGIEVMSSKHFVATLQYNGGFGDGYSANAGAVELIWRF